MNYLQFEDESEAREIQQQMRFIQQNDKLMKAKDQIMTEVINQNNIQLPSLKRENSEQIRAKQQALNQVVMMGYDLDVVEYAAVKVGSNSVQAIIEFLSKGENGLFHHEFVPSHGDLCYLCKED